MNYQYDDLSGGYADNSAFAVGDDGKFQPISHRQTHHEQKENNIYRHNYTTISSSSSAAASSAASSSIEIHSGNRTNAYKPHNHKNNNPTTNKSDQSEQIVNFAKHIIEKYNTEKNMDTIYEPNATIILNSNTMCYGSQWNFILKLFPNIRTTNIKIKNVKLDGDKVFVNWTNGYYKQMFIIRKTNNNLSVEYHKIMSIKHV